jgi:flagellar biosynthetic protein FliO
MVNSGPLIPLISGRSIAVVVIAIAILAAAAYLLRRASPLRRSRHQMSVETALSLGERRSLVIVAVEGRRLLLGMTPTYVGLVAELGASFSAALNSSIDASLDPSPDPASRVDEPR